MRRGSSSWPVTIWNRRLNSSSLFSASFWQLVVGELAQFGRGGHSPPSSRFTNLVFTGSLCDAAHGLAGQLLGTPDSSNRTRPGLTAATQWSGEPLPEPIRVSSGFW
jgi:hypothetical protein